MAGDWCRLPPEIAGKLADVARELREHISGEQACPKWGTRFTQIEDQGMQVGLELARVFMQQSRTSVRSRC